MKKTRLTLKTGFIGYFVLLFAFALLMFGALNNLTRTITQLQQAQDSRFQVSSLVNEFNAITQAMARNAMAFVSSEQPEFQQHFQSEYQQLTAASDSDSSIRLRIEQAPLNPLEKQHFTEAHSLALALADVQKEAMSTASGQFDDGQGGIRVALPNTLMAQALLFNQAHQQQSQQLTQLIQSIDQSQSERILIELNAATHDSQRAFAFALLALATLILGSGIGLWGLYKSIKTPLNQGVALATELAAGNLQARIENTRDDELGLLLQALNGIGFGLQQAMDEVQRRSHDIYTASQQLVIGNQELKNFSSEQATHLDRTRLTCESLAHTILNETQNVELATELSQEAATLSLNGATLSNNLMHTMRSIQNSAKEMSAITELIQNIAFQTNILALNAAVEAARAGTEGRGFAVVAAEVRQLALRSSQASHDIETLINNSLKQVQLGNDSVNQTSAMIQSIQQSIDKVRHIMQDVSHSFNEQKIKVEDVTVAMTTLDQITAQNLQVVDSAVRSTHSQLEHVHGLNQVVALFEAKHHRPLNTISHAA